jgi:hypothetical protein
MSPINNPTNFKFHFFLESDGVVTLDSTQTLELGIESLQMDMQVLVLSRTIPSSSTSNLGPSIPIIETIIEIDEHGSSVLIANVAKKGNLNDKPFKLSRTLELPKIHGSNLS